MSSDIVSTLQINKRMHSIQEQQISQQHQVSYTSILSSAVRPIKIAGSFKYSEFKLLVLTIPSSRCRITPGELIGKYTYIYIYIKSYIFQWLILPFFFFFWFTFQTSTPRGKWLSPCWTKSCSLCLSNRIMFPVPRSGFLEEKSL